MQPSLPAPSKAFLTCSGVSVCCCQAPSNLSSCHHAPAGCCCLWVLSQIGLAFRGGGPQTHDHLLCTGIAQFCIHPAGVKSVDSRATLQMRTEMQRRQLLCCAALLLCCCVTVLLCAVLRCAALCCAVQCAFSYQDQDECPCSYQGFRSIAKVPSQIWSVLVYYLFFYKRNPQ